MERQLKRIRRAKAKNRAKNSVNPTNKATKQQKKANFERLEEMTDGINFESSVEEQDTGSVATELYPGESYTVVVDRISAKGNAIVDLPDRCLQNHINIGDVDVKEGVEVEIEITEVYDTYAKAQTGFVWNDQKNSQKSITPSPEKSSRVSENRPHSSILDNKNHLLRKR